MELCFTVGVANVINRFHATFLTDVDAVTVEEMGNTPPLPHRRTRIRHET
jgi:hypothetical protein